MNALESERTHSIRRMDWKSTLVLTLVNTFAGLAFGFSFVGINIALNVLYPCALQMADDEKWRYALLMSAMNFGAIFGSPLTAPIDRLVTRKYTMVLGGASGAIVTIASAFAPTYVGQIIPRIIGGMSIGVISATAPNYVSDNASPNIRGVLGSSFQFALNFAIIAGSLASYFVLGEHRDLSSSAYRIALGVEALAACEYKLKILLLSSSVPYILITLFFLLPIFPRDQSERELIMNSLDCEELLTTVAFVRPIRGWILNLSLAACNQLSGVSAVMFYCNVFLSTAHVRAVMLGTVIIMSWNLLSSLFPLWMSKKCNRRPVLICSTGITGFALLLLPLAGRFLPVHYAASMSLAIIAIYLLSFQCGIGSLYWIMCNEIYPESFPFINALTWTMATGVVLIFPVLQSMMGLFVFCVFSAFSFICLLIFIFMLPETRDKPLSEIRQILNQPGWIVR